MDKTANGGKSFLSRFQCFKNLNRIFASLDRSVIAKIGHEQIPLSRNLGNLITVPNSNQIKNEIGAIK